LTAKLYTLICNLIKKIRELYKAKPTSTYLLRRGLKLKVTGVILVILAVGVEVIDRL